MKRTPKNIELNIIKEYLSGLTMDQTADKCGVTKFVVFRTLKSYNIQARPINKLDQEKITNICDLYKSGQSTYELANKFNVSVKTICDVLKRAGIPRNNRYSNKKLDLNYWENIDRPDKAYFLGLMITDGCVYSHRNVTLSLTESDKHILEVYRKYTGNEVKIHTQQKQHLNKKNECVFNVSCSKWVDDLSKYGVIPRKTSTVEMPVLKKELMPHLLRGMFDGDGWIANGRQIGICGNQQCVTAVHDWLVKELNVYNTKVSQTGPHLWQTIWSSKKDFKTICDYLYKDKSDLYIARKYNKFSHDNPEVSEGVTTITTVTRRS